MDVLSVLFLHLLNDKHSFLSSIRDWWSLELDFGPFEDVSVSLRSSGILIFLGLWLCYQTCSEDSLIKLPEVCPFGVDLFSLIPVLSFSSSHRKYDRIFFKCHENKNYQINGDIFPFLGYIYINGVII